MALLTSLPPESSDKRKKHTSSSSKRIKKKTPPPPPPPPKPTSSWDQIKNYLTCKQIDGSTVRDPSMTTAPAASAGNSKVQGGSCSSICSFRDVVSAGNSCRVVHRADNSPETNTSSTGGGGQESRLLRKKSGHGSSSSSRSLMSNSVRSTNSNNNTGSTTTNYAGGGGGGSSSSSRARGMPLRKLSGCYECHTIVDPSRYPIARTTICSCKECGEVFPKIESLEHHQAVRHAVSELGPEDSSRNIVEIIFKSSWLKKDNPFCSIERILKVHNTLRTIQRFEDCRDAVKIRANCNTKKNPRCAADGNELLRFHCTTLTCSLGARGSSSLCGSVPGCGVCTIIRHGFQGSKSSGVRTTASSGRAHDFLGGNDYRRAMLVCRVIAGRVKRLGEDTATTAAEGAEDVEGGGVYDSVAGYAGMYSNLEELYVYNPRAILPCFVVIYNAVES